MPVFEASYSGPGKPWRVRLRNTIALVGLDLVLSNVLDPGADLIAQTTYFGLIDNTSFSEIDEEDTMASHAGWTELTSYNEATRVAYSSTLTNEVLTSSSPAVFTMSANGTIRGFFMVNNAGLVGAATKGSTNGTLWSMAVADEGHAVAKGGLVTVTYTCRAAGGHR
jgi:hypothetical protein